MHQNNKNKKNQKILKIIFNWTTEHTLNRKTMF